MKCSKCQLPNPDGAKFCIECGSPLEFHCPKCGAPTPGRGKFCMECGNLLASAPPAKPRDLSFDEMITKIQKYLPQGLTEKILAQRDRIEGEKKQVTVMFCDMEGYTAIAERLGPEGVYTLMDQVYEILIHKVNDYGGTVNELTGDGIMALFGAPVALEDAPQRAIRSSLAIHKEITRYGEKMGEGTPALRMRIGIHSGPVVVGTVGNDLRVDFKAIGDTVNLASRIESIAEPATTYVTEETFKLTEGFFRFENLGERDIKGKAAPVRVYRVLAPSSRRTRFDVSAERGLTTFVGRGRELELLLDGFDRAKEGNGQAFSIIGEAGIGKSRFLYEFRKAVSNEDITFLEGKCLSYGKGIPYHPISDVLKGNFDISEGDTDEAIRKKVKKSLEIIKADEVTTLPYLLELLGAKDSGIDRIMMSPEGRKERIIEAVRQIILKGAQMRPLVITIEDLHWADQSTENALKWLLESVPGVRVLVIFTYRPEFVHTWGGRSYHNQITLNRLSNRENLLMVSHILDSSDLDPELQKLILTKTEGVPFFIEEFVRSLSDLEFIKEENGKALLGGDPGSITIPSTIQDMIMARVDRLSDAAKSVLQAGSVIEREFAHELIRKVTQLSETELLSYFSALKDAELLYERGIYPKTSYIFHHALTRQVVYSSILARRRKELHGEIARSMEEMQREDLTPDYELLAEHFFQSEDFAQAAAYYKRAARKAEKSSSLLDAITHARKRIVCLDKLPDAVRELIDARTVLGLYLTHINHHVEARDAVEPIMVPASEKGFRRRLCQIQTIMGSFYGLIKEEFPIAIDVLDDALLNASNEQDIITAVLATYWLGTLHAYNADFGNSKTAFQKVVGVNITANNLWGVAATKGNMAYFVHFYNGEVQSLFELSSEALRIAQESGDPFSKGICQSVYAVACYAKARLQDAEKYSLEGKKICERSGHFSWAGGASACLALTYLEMKDFQKAKAAFDQAVGFWRLGPFPSWVRLVELGTAVCNCKIGEKGIHLERLRSIPKENKIKIIEGWICRLLGEILLNLGQDHFLEAENWIRRSIEADARNGTRFQLGLDHAAYADLFKRQGDRSKVQEHLGKTMDILRECGADGWVVKYQEELAMIS